MSELGELSSTEIELIKKHRAKRQRVVDVDYAQALCLSLADSFASHLREVGERPSYSEFVNQYDGLENSKAYFEAVSALWVSALEWAERIVPQVEG